VGDLEGIYEGDEVGLMDEGVRELGQLEIVGRKDGIFVG